MTLLAGADHHLTTFNLNQELTHADYEQQLTHFLRDNQHVIVFADMTGGAPHQIASRLIIEKANKQQFIVSSAPLNLMLDILMKNNLGIMTEDNVKMELANSVAMSKELIVMLPEAETDKGMEWIDDEGI